jgi:ABC-type amino acid transport system permease subunit
MLLISMPACDSVLGLLVRMWSISEKWLFCILVALVMVCRYLLLSIVSWYMAVLCSVLVCRRFRFESRNTYVLSILVLRLESSVSSEVLKAVICAFTFMFAGGFGDL